MKKTKLLTLRPTQMAIGFLEVADKLRQLKKLKKRKLKREIANSPIEVILSPPGHLYVIDGHHRAFAYWLLGVKTVPVEIKFRFPKNTSYNRFWKKMIKEKWVHPYNESGNGPIDFIYLAQDIRGVGNDPYRSLAWMVREKGGYKKTDVTFSDFKWAQYFRRRKLLHCHYSPRFTDILPRAIQMTKSMQCSKFPGYIKRQGF